MKVTFNIKLNTQFTIDFSSFGLSDAQQRGGYETKMLIVKLFLEHCGADEFEVYESNNTLFETMAAVVKAQHDYVLAHKDNFKLKNLD